MKSTTRYELCRDPTSQACKCKVTETRRVKNLIHSNAQCSLCSIARATFRLQLSLNCSVHIICDHVYYYATGNVMCNVPVQKTMCNSWCDETNRLDWSLSYLSRAIDDAALNGKQYLRADQKVYCSLCSHMCYCAVGNVTYNVPVQEGLRGNCVLPQTCFLSCFAYERNVKSTPIACALTTKMSSPA